MCNTCRKWWFNIKSALGEWLLFWLSSASSTIDTDLNPGKLDVGSTFGAIQSTTAQHLYFSVFVGPCVRPVRVSVYWPEGQGVTCKWAVFIGQTRRGLGWQRWFLFVGLRGASGRPTDIWKARPESYNVCQTKPAVYPMDHEGEGKAQPYQCRV